ncbi:hypothetical protein B0H19DRAFT_471810 [Mycena capillaripes]|nr:hypothetical protein B0H19DRAFT_471810 [Mycena capillaripes]
MEGFSFPLDLEREIFETAAVRSRAMIPTLLRVCRRVHVWLEPLLYRVVGADSRLPISAVESKPATFLQNAVRHFLYNKGSTLRSKEWQKTLLSNCPDITNLFIYGPLEPDLICLLDKMHVQKLHLILPLESPVSALNHPLFQSVTHLFVYQYQNRHPPPPRHRMFRTCPRKHSFSNDAATAVVMVMSTVMVDDWKTGAEGGDDFWVRADAFLARKRKGEIESTCYLLDEITKTSPPSNWP